MRPALDCPFTFVHELLVPSEAGRTAQHTTQHVGQPAAQHTAQHVGQYAEQHVGRHVGRHVGQQIGQHVVHQELLDGDLPDLIEEAWTRSVLAELLPADPAGLHVTLRPVAADDGTLTGIAVELDGPQGSSRLVFGAGRWSRRTAATLAALREEGSLPAEGVPQQRLVAEPRSGAPSFAAPDLLPPPVTDGSLEDCGVRTLDPGDLVPDRPVLVNAQLESELLALTEQAGAREIGGGTLGKLVRLPAPLPGTRTRIVTILSAAVPDERHVGTVGRVTFSPQALAEAHELAGVRGLGESVLTVYHSHGWGKDCGLCNQSATCRLPECTLVSHDDYEVLESLVPGKATVLPIAGRRLGAPGQHPVLAVHAWRGGLMRPLRWRRYRD